MNGVATKYISNYIKWFKWLQIFDTDNFRAFNSKPNYIQQHGRLINFNNGCYVVSYALKHQKIYRLYMDCKKTNKISAHFSLTQTTIHINLAIIRTAEYN